MTSEALPFDADFDTRSDTDPHPEIRGLDGAFVPCSSKNEWCVLPDGHAGRCRASLPGEPKPPPPSKRNRSSRSPAAAGSRSASRRSRSKPSLAPAVLGLAYGRLGVMIEQGAPEPAGPPVGRVMQFQSVLAGQQLDQLLSNVPVYKRATQLGGSGVLDAIGSLVAAPMLAGLMASNENVARSLWPMLAAALQSSAIEMAKAQKAQLQAMEQVSEYDEAANAILSELFDSLFAVRPETEQAEQ